MGIGTNEINGVKILCAVRLPHPVTNDFFAMIHGIKSENGRTLDLIKFKCSIREGESKGESGNEQNQNQKYFTSRLFRLGVHQ